MHCIALHRSSIQCNTIVYSTTQDGACPMHALVVLLLLSRRPLPSRAPVCRDRGFWNQSPLAATSVAGCSAVRGARCADVTALPFAVARDTCTAVMRWDHTCRWAHVLAAFEVMWCGQSHAPCAIIPAPPRGARPRSSLLRNLAVRQASPAPLSPSSLWLVAIWMC